MKFEGKFHETTENSQETKESFNPSHVVEVMQKSEKVNLSEWQKSLWDKWCDLFRSWTAGFVLLAGTHLSEPPTLAKEWDWGKQERTAAEQVVDIKEQESIKHSLAQKFFEKCKGLSYSETGDNLNENEYADIIRKQVTVKGFFRILDSLNSVVLREGILPPDV